MRYLQNNTLGVLYRMFLLSTEFYNLIKKKLENQDRNIELVFSYLPVGFKQSVK